MTALAFDTLKTARTLESKGFSREQSEALAEQLAESRSRDPSHLAPQEELKATRNDVRHESAEVRTSIAEAKTDLLKVIVTVAVLKVATVIGATVIGAMIGIAKLPGH